MTKLSTAFFHRLLGILNSSSLNDASTDRTSEILNQHRDPRIIIINNSINLRLAKSLNKGISLSQGMYIARMDADDISLPDRLYKQYSFLENNTDIDILGTAAILIDKEGTEIGNKIYPSECNLINGICPI